MCRCNLSIEVLCSTKMLVSLVVFTVFWSFTCSSQVLPLIDLSFVSAATVVHDWKALLFLSGMIINSFDCYCLFEPEWLVKVLHGCCCCHASLVPDEPWGLLQTSFRNQWPSPHCLRSTGSSIQSWYISKLTVRRPFISAMQSCRQSLFAVLHCSVLWTHTVFACTQTWGRLLSTPWFLIGS